jgi:hypothetical protein
MCAGSQTPKHGAGTPGGLRATRGELHAVSTLTASISRSFSADPTSLRSSHGSTDPPRHRAGIVLCGCRSASDAGPFHKRHRPSAQLLAAYSRIFATVIAQRVILISPPKGPHCSRTKP